MVEAAIGRHAQQAQVPGTGKTLRFFPRAGWREPRFSWGRQCNGQLIREGSMEEESLKYLLGSALRGGVGGGEGDSGGWGGISLGKAAGPTQELWWGQAPCHTGISSLILIVVQRRAKPGEVVGLAKVSQQGLLPPQL